MSDSTSPVPLEYESFTPPRRSDGERLVVSPLNNAVMRAPGPGAPAHPQRNVIMRAIVQGVACGLTVPQTLEQLRLEGIEPPRVSTVYAWYIRYPRFKEALDQARYVSAFTLLDEARDDVEGLESKEQAFCARVKADTKIKLAERWAPERFGPRVGAAVGVQVVINTSLPMPGDDQPTVGFRVKAQPLAASGKDQPTDGS